MSWKERGNSLVTVFTKMVHFQISNVLNLSCRSLAVSGDKERGVQRGNLLWFPPFD